MDEKQRDQMTAKLKGDATFLEGLADRAELGEVDVQRLRMIAEFLKPAEVEDEEKVGLNRWSVRDWSRRPRQTGMEQQNERVVLELLNLFAGLDIPFYILNASGQKTGRQYSNSERLSMVTAKFGQLVGDANEARAKTATAEAAQRAAERLVGVYKVAHDAAVHELAQLAETSIAAARAMLILEQAVPATETVVYGEPNDRGVRQVTLDAREVILRLCLQRIVHDLAPNEQLCKRCLGLGIVKHTSPYGIGERKPGEDAFPFHHQWLSDCPNCYMGKTVHCELCQAALPRARTRCECPAAQALLAQEKADKEIERRKTVPRIKLAEYPHPMVWCDATDKYLDVDSIDDHLEEHPDAVFFGCEPSGALTVPEASRIIEDLQNNATEEAAPEDGDEVLDFTKEAEAELDALLKTWAEKNVSARDLYYPNMNLIVEVDRGELATDGVLDVQPDAAGGDDAQGSP